MFDTVVSRCIEEGLVKGDGFAIDASLIRADASMRHAQKGPIDWNPSKTPIRAVKEYLEKLDQDVSLSGREQPASG